MTVNSSSIVYSGKDNLEAMRHARRYNRFLLELILRFAPRSGRVLDFGAGLGLFAEALRDSGYDVSCIEVDAEFAEGLTVRGLRTVSTPDELPDGTIDYLYSLNVLEHIEDDAQALSALMPKLAADARCMFFVPAFPILYSRMDRIVGHYRRYTAASLRRVLEKAGLRVDYVAYADSLGFPAALAYRLGGGNGHLSSTSVKIYDRFLFPASRTLDRVTERWFGKNVFAVAVKR